MDIEGPVAPRDLSLRVGRFPTVPVIIAVCICAGCNDRSDRNDTASRLSAAATPPDALVDRVEREVRSRPCVGDLNRWDRLYTYGGRGGVVDKTTVYVFLREAGRFGFVPRRRSGFPEEGFNLDDRPYKMFIAKFNTSNGRFSDEYCGPNAPSPEK